MNKILVAQLFWWHSGTPNIKRKHCYKCNLVHLCQNKLGTERNTIPNGLICKYIL